MLGTYVMESRSKQVIVRQSKRCSVGLKESRQASGELLSRYVAESITIDAGLLATKAFVNCVQTGRTIL